MNVKTLLGNRLLVSPEPVEDRTPGGVLFAQAYTPEQQIYRVLAVGTGTTRRKKGKPDVHIPIEIPVGSRVLIDKYMINDKAQAGENQWIINADHVSLAFP